MAGKGPRTAVGAEASMVVLKTTVDEAKDDEFEVCGDVVEESGEALSGEGGLGVVDCERRRVAITQTDDM